MRKIILWLMVLFYASFFSGHVYELIAVIPNWRSGEIADVTKYNQFFSHASPADFYLFAALGSLIFSVLGLIAVIRRGRVPIITALLAVVVFFVYGVYSYAYFIPTNIYIAAGEYDPATLKTMVSVWVFHEPFRLALLGVGLLASIWCFESSRKADRVG